MRPGDDAQYGEGLGRAHRVVSIRDGVVTCALKGVLSFAPQRCSVAEFWWECGRIEPGFPRWIGTLSAWCADLGRHVSILGQRR